MTGSGIRIGLIGAGRWAGVHRRALIDLGTPPVAVLVRSEETRARVAAEWQLPATTDREAFLAEDLDAVIVVSPNYLHAEHAIAVLEAGKHVLVEKPMATRLEDCDRMLAAARQAERVLAVGLEMRVFTLFRRVKELLDQGAVGRPLHLKLDLWRRPYRSGAGGWKTDPEKLGSSILEEPIHYLDLVRWYLGDALGEPKQLQAWANSRSGREGMWENLDVGLEFAGGARAWVTRSIAAYQHHVTLMLVGEEGALRAAWNGKMDVDPEPRASLTLNQGSRTEAVAVPQRTGHAYDLPRQARSFFDAIRLGTPPPADGTAGRAAVALCLAVETSLREDSRVVFLAP